MKKNKCVICGETKGRRECRLHDGAKVCSVCCATTRTRAMCGDCEHMRGRGAVRENPMDKEFVVEIDEAFEDEVDGILEKMEAGEISYEGTLRKLERIHKRNPNNYFIYFALGAVQGVSGNHAEALVNLERCIEINPICIEAYVNKVAVYMDMKDIVNVIRANWQVMDMTESSDEHHKKSRELNLMIERDTCNEKGMTLEQYVEIGDLFNKAFEVLQKQQFETAIKMFEEVLATSPAHHQSYGNIGMAYAQLGRKAKSLEMLRKALEVNPDYKFAIQNIVVIEKLMTEGEPLSEASADIRFNYEYPG